MSALMSLKNPSEKFFRRKVLFIFAFIVLDAVATVWFLSIGFGEVNPAMDWVAQVFSPVCMAVAKIVWSLTLLISVVKAGKFREYINYLIVSYIVVYASSWLYQILWEVYKWTQLTNG